MNKVRMGDILQLHRGYDLPEAKREEGTVPIISSSGFSGWHNQYKCCGPNVITGRYGTIGEVFYYDGNCWPLNTALYVSDFKGNNPKYIYYLLKHVLKIDGKDKSTVPGVDRNVLHEMKIPFCADTEIQAKTIAVLESIDSKLKNNNEICSDLESMAKLLYDYWFVQFDFPDENGKPYKSSGGKMVWNEELKREIPEGWEVTSLGALCSFMNGINYDKNIVGDKKYRIVNVRNITASTLLLDDTDFDDITLKSAQADRYIIKENDILIARSGVPGTTRLLLNSDNNTIFCGFIIRCKPHHPAHRLYLTYQLKQLEGTGATTTGGSILQNVSQDTLSRVLVLVPSISIIEQFNTQLTSMLDVMQNCIEENQQLATLRDFLLPMLMNGQVKVQENPFELQQRKA